MGVSLERVQNKFACIIGELCNEPLVLSQFAVWLDMRLAEYKAKGSICLECSDDIPKPTWLKGLPLKEGEIDPTLSDEWPAGMLHDDTGQSNYEADPSRDNSLMRNIRQHNIKHRYLESRRQFDPHSDNGIAQSLPIHSMSASPGIAHDPSIDLASDIIKKEPVDQDIIPVSLHSSDNFYSESRKRSSDLQYPSSSKHQRLSHSEISPLNQPLSAIIDPQDTPQSSSNTPVDHVTALSNQSFNQNVDDDDDDIQVEIISGPSSLLQSPSTSSKPYMTSSNPDYSTFTSADSDPSLHYSQSDASLLSSDMANTSEMNMVYIRSRDLLGTDSTSSPNRYTQRKTLSSVKLFQRWLATNVHEQRQIRTIDPPELDRYLTSFLTTCQKVGGGNYTAKSLKGLRESIERHLKESGYPVSIITSPAFANSQRAYKLRFRELLSLAQSGMRSTTS